MSVKGKDEKVKKETCPHKKYRTCRFTGKRCNNCNDKKFNPAHIQIKIYSQKGGTNG